MIHLFIRLFIHSFIYSYIHLFIHSFIHSYIHTFIHLYIHTFIHSYIHTFIHSYIHTFIHSYIHTFLDWLIDSINHWLIHLYIHSSPHSLIHLFRLVLWRRAATSGSWASWTTGPEPPPSSPRGPSGSHVSLNFIYMRIPKMEKNKTIHEKHWDVAREIQFFWYVHCTSQYSSKLVIYGKSCSLKRVRDRGAETENILQSLAQLPGSNVS